MAGWMDDSGSVWSGSRTEETDALFRTGEGRQRYSGDQKSETASENASVLHFSDGMNI